MNINRPNEIRIASILALFATAIAGCPSTPPDATASGGASQTSTGSSASASGSGGAGGSVPMCTPGAAEACYDGAPSTRGHGQCKDGMHTCGDDGLYGACNGEVLPAPKEDCAKKGDEDCDGVACSEVVWGAAYGDPMSTSAGMAIAVDASGNTIVVDWLVGDLDFDVDGFLSPTGDLIVAKLDPQGHEIWAELYPGPTAQPSFLDVAVDATGNILLAGGFVGKAGFGGPALVSAGGEDVFVAKLDPSSAHLWSRSFGDASGQRATHVAALPDGSVLLSGLYTGDLDFGGGVTVSHPSATSDVDAFVVKLDAAKGDAVWAVTYGDPAVDETAAHIAAFPDGGALVAGGFQGTISLGGQDLASPADEDAYVAKLDAMGKHVYSHRYGGVGDQHISGAGSDSLGAALVAGNNAGTFDFGLGALTAPAGFTAIFTAKLDATGAPTKSRQIAGTADAKAVALAVDKAGELVLTGMLSAPADFGGGMIGPSNGPPAPFLAKLDGSLAHLWSKSFSVAGAANVDDLAVDLASGAPTIAGDLAGSINPGAGVIASMMCTSLWIAGFEP